MNTELEGFWSQIIDGYFRHDIKQLEAIDIGDEKYGLCAVEQFMAVASTLELLGKLLSKSAAKIANEDAAWAYYFKHYLAEHKKIKGAIHALVRHGVAHLFLPKYIGISKSVERDALMFKNEEGLPVLNVSKLTSLFIASLNKVKDDLTNDPELSKRFLANYTQLLQSSDSDFDNYRITIDEYIVDHPSTQAETSYKTKSTQEYRQPPQTTVPYRTPITSSKSDD
ncbi:hypothetical protein [Spirosoma endbachense]|uniref:Uncharacterized protein n=1 Tax=Spirosoma endbachense TaxID=2666025 RepID=A0A6P1VX16_9BACT|nr:hypothetical protein [Spirosoma endbachense]QHV97295.1 hypothetical protein GJR95_20800 [Spirosoma endbachense]